MDSLSTRSTDSQESYSSFPGRSGGAIPKSSSTGTQAFLFPIGTQVLKSTVV